MIVMNLVLVLPVSFLFWSAKEIALGKFFGTSNGLGNGASCFLLVRGRGSNRRRLGEFGSNDLLCCIDYKFKL